MTYVDKIKGKEEEAKIPPMISEFQSSYVEHQEVQSLKSLFYFIF